MKCPEPRKWDQSLCRPELKEWTRAEGRKSKKERIIPVFRQREGEMTQGEYGLLQTKERGLKRNKLYRHLDLGLQACRIVRK